MKTLLGKYYDALRKAEAGEKLSCHIGAIKNKIDLLEEGGYESTTLDEVWADYFLGIKSQLLGLCRKVGFVYHMVKGNTTCESYIELPVSEERFGELYFYISDTESECYNEIRSALRNIAKLQGYRLTNFIPEFTIERRKDI